MHPQAGRFNAGEKLVFWFALGAGAAVIVSGYLLMFLSMFARIHSVISRSPMGNSLQNKIAP